MMAESTKKQSRVGGWRHAMLRGLLVGEGSAVSRLWWLQLVCLAITIVAIILGAGAINDISNLYLRGVTWMAAVVFVLVFGDWLFGAPYRGMRAFRDEVVQDLEQLERSYQKLGHFVAWRDAQKGHEKEYLHLTVRRLRLDANRLSASITLVNGLLYAAHIQELTITPTVGLISCKPHSTGFLSLLPGRSTQQDVTITLDDDEVKALRAAGRSTLSLAFSLKETNSPVTLESEELPLNC